MNTQSKNDGQDSVNEYDRDRLLTVPQAAAFLGLSTGGLYHLIGQRRVPVIRISARCVRFSRRALTDWVESHSQPAERGDL
jgi:excisionase family DNA binding protein